jgi:hypothetical protein
MPDFVKIIIHILGGLTAAAIILTTILMCLRKIKVTPKKVFLMLVGLFCVVLYISVWSDGHLDIFGIIAQRQYRDEKIASALSALYTAEKYSDDINKREPTYAIDKAIEFLEYENDWYVNNEGNPSLHDVPTEEELKKIYNDPKITNLKDLLQSIRDSRDVSQTTLLTTQLQSDYADIIVYDDVPFSKTDFIYLTLELIMMSSEDDPDYAYNLSLSLKNYFKNDISQYKFADRTLEKEFYWKDILNNTGLINPPWTFLMPIINDPSYYAFNYNNAKQGTVYHFDEFYNVTTVDPSTKYEIDGYNGELFVYDIDKSMIEKLNNNTIVGMSGFDINEEYQQGLSPFYTFMLPDRMIAQNYESIEYIIYIDKSYEYIGNYEFSESAVQYTTYVSVISPKERTATLIAKLVGPPPPDSIVVFESSKLGGLTGYDPSVFSPPVTATFIEALKQLGINNSDVSYSLEDLSFLK